ncbi:MAG: hypothetical protein WBP29_11110 [Candidatus Zixiibacteriota bacterium]
MLVYPNLLGFDIGLSGPFYFLCEIAYFFGVAFILNRDRNVVNGLLSAAIVFAGRLSLSLIFCVYLLVMERVPFGDAAADGFLSFKPAVFLFTLTAPFVFGSFARGILGIRNRRLTKGNQDRKIIDGSPRPVQSYTPSYEPAQTHASVRPASEYFSRTFNEAVAHVGQYSGVQCAMLIDADGLPVAGWSRGVYDQEMWGALSRKLVDEIGDTCALGGAARPFSVEFKSGNERFLLQSVSDMWLVSIADAASDELEKIRVSQAVEMVTRHLQERYKNVYTTEAGRTYAGSTV